MLINCIANNYTISIYFETIIISILFYIKNEKKKKIFNYNF